MNKSKIVESTQQELQKLHAEYNRIKSESEVRGIKLVENERVTNHLRERLQKTEQKLLTTSRKHKKVSQEVKLKMGRLQSLYKSAIHTIKAELGEYKKSISQSLNQDDVVVQIKKFMQTHITKTVKENYDTEVFSNKLTFLNLIAFVLSQPPLVGFL